MQEVEGGAGAWVSWVSHPQQVQRHVPQTPAAPAD